MLGLVGFTTMRPMAPDFSRPIDFHVRPPSVDLKMPQPGEMVLRESSSPVPAHTCIVSLGAIASSPIETQRWLSNTGRNEVPALDVFQMPPAAPAMKNVVDGLGMPTTLDVRPPIFAGPMLRQRKAASVAESSGGALCAVRGATTVVARTARSGRSREFIDGLAECWEKAPQERLPPAIRKPPPRCWPRRRPARGALPPRAGSQAAGPPPARLAGRDPSRWSDA